jgi:hypothetical protein
MAVLVAADRDRIHKALMRLWSRDREAVAILSADIRAAVDATDTWIDSNSASFNTALPQPARNSLTATQKTMLFMAVAAMRHGVSFLRQIFGEVD